MTKYAYTLNKASGTYGTTVTFNGASTFGLPSSEFSGSTGTYTLVVNPATLAATLTVTSSKCIISYSLTFQRGIPSKFLKLL
ncbi:MAG: hypothetical protein ACLPN5_07175 [Roseiarcus sp.]